jgi:hypothetical protein
MSFTSARIHERLEALLCEEKEHRKPPGCVCTALHRHYGTNIFKCPYPSCSLSRSGFPTHAARKAHVDSHARPWKCPDPSCFYATMGFASRRDQQKHWEELHKGASEPAGLASATQDSFSGDDLKVLLFELTKAGDVDALRRITTRMKWARRDAEPACLLAAKMGSLPMLKILTQSGSEANSPSSRCYFAAVVNNENPALLRWVLGKLCKWPLWIGGGEVQVYENLVPEAFSTRSPEMYAEWEDFLLDPTRQLTEQRSTSIRKSVHREMVPTHNIGTLCKVRALIPHSMKLSAAFSSPVFSAVKNDALLEARLIKTWHCLIEAVGPLDPRFLGWSLNMLSRSSSHSLTMAAELLRLGAPIDFPRGRASLTGKLRLEPLDAKDVESMEHSKFNNKRKQVPQRSQKWQEGMTALHYASRATSERAARFARFLLEEGADPTYQFGDVTPAEEKGAELMQKWLGESWDEVVERTRAARQRRKREEGGDLGDGLDEDEEEGLPNPKRRRESRKMEIRAVDSEHGNEQIGPPR